MKKLIRAAALATLTGVFPASAEMGFLTSATNDITYAWRARLGGSVIREIKTEYYLCNDGNNCELDTWRPLSLTVLN